MTSPNDADSVARAVHRQRRDTPEDLVRNLEWLGLTGCTCPHQWRKSVGSLYRISFGAGWVRLTDAPDCPFHGLEN
jgi:hypothetical protein